MTYVLMIWTVVAATVGHSKQYPMLQHDWRPIAEFHANGHSESNYTTLTKCQEAARQLGLKSERYRCVRTK